MNQSIGRTSEPTTKAGAPDAGELDPGADSEAGPDAAQAAPDTRLAPDVQPDPDVLRDPAVRSRVRDVPPPIGYEVPAFTDPDATGPIVDPLDPHKPGPESGDPLDPDSHVI